MPGPARLHILNPADRDNSACLSHDSRRGSAPETESHTETINLYAAWFGILAGFTAGAVQGMFFHDDNWLGGYTSWTRRMTRLGHIAFFGIGFVNLAYALTVRTLWLVDLSPWPSWLFIVGAIGMPLVCYLSAFWKPLRHLFFIPVLCLLTGTIIFIFGDVLS